MKPVKNLVANQGECHTSNPLNNFVGSISGSVEKSRLVNRLAASSGSSQLVSPQISHQSHSELADAAFYNLRTTAPTLARPPTQEDWVGQFSSGHAPVKEPLYRPHIQSAMNPVQHFGAIPPMPMYNHFHAPVFTPQRPLMSAMVPSVAQSAESVQTGAQQPLSVNDDLAAAKRMVEMLRNSGNPKYANSTFVDFIDQVANRQLRFKDGTVVDKDGKVVDWDSLYEEDPDQTTGGLGDLLDTAGDDAENFPDQMDRIWNELRQDHDFLNDAYGYPSASSSEYVFQHASNPYIDSSESNLIELARRLMLENRDSEAVQALEAEVRLNPNSSEGWKLLGQLNAQFDRDIDAIKCLQKGHECDEFNLESMMALGVSLTNELDTVKAMNILKKWISNHENYHDLINEPIDPPSAVPDYDFVRLRKEVMTLFTRAQARDGEDFDVAIALGVLHNINRDYAFAIESFIRAVEIRPADFTAWNKLGATLANSGLSREALTVYHQALAIKPNYARAWSNLAIAHSNMNDYESASKFFITALQLSPGATHLWSSLFIALSNWVPERGELGDFVESKNLSALIQAIPGIPRIDSLPQSSSPSSESTLKVISELRTSLLGNQS